LKYAGPQIWGEKHKTPTFFLSNWKAEERPIFDDVAWNFNIQENKLVGWHQYSYRGIHLILAWKKTPNFYMSGLMNGKIQKQLK
jgi:hypothetical protein